MLRFVFILLSAAVLAPAASFLEQRIDQLIRTSPAIEPAEAGIEIVQLATGKVLYSRNAEKLMTPASNTKLFTTALALLRLGPEHSIATRVYASQNPDASGRVAGNVTLVGRGDPSMTFFQIPYDKDATLASPLAGIEMLADALTARGIRSISGDIIGDDTAFPTDLFPVGWGANDALWEYGAPVSALCIGNNSIRVELTPGTQAGDPVRIEITPPLEYFVIDNRLRTAAVEPPGSSHSKDERLHIQRVGGRQLQISGSVLAAAEKVTIWLAIDDPALYAATALYDALTRRGVSITGKPTVRHRYEPAVLDAPIGTVLAERSSPPLIALLGITDKVSQNLWAEMMLRQVALVRTGDGTLKAGLAELKAFLTEFGIADTEYNFDDGSGLARGNLVKPDAVVKLLRFMYASPSRETWISLLPVGGQDGTLTKRFDKNPAAKSIRAKTGSLSHVNALSGYADSATYGEIAFSIIVNHTGAPASEVRSFIDKIGMIVLD